MKKCNECLICGKKNNIPCYKEISEESAVADIGQIEHLKNGFYSLTCSCLSHKILLELEDDLIQQYFEMATHHWSWWKKFKAGIDLLLGRDVVFDSDFIFRDFDQALAFCKLIVDHVEKVSAKKVKNKDEGKTT